MKKHPLAIIYQISAAILLAAGMGILCGCSSNSTHGTPQAGDRYEVTGPVYYYGIYRNLNKRELTKELAVGTLTAVRFSGPEVAFREDVPIGTVMTIIGPAPKVWHLPFMANRYFVELDPGSSRGLDVILGLNRGVEGELDGLNPELFRKLPRADDAATEITNSGVESDGRQ